MTLRNLSRRGGWTGGGRIPPSPVSGQGGGGDGEKVFFDDGQVRVTESLVTIGPPWNKVFAVSQIRGVTFGINRSNELSDAIVRLVGLVLVFAGVLALAAGFMVGFMAGVLTGIGILWGRPKADAPFSVNLDFGGTWATEYLSTKNETWAEAVAIAIGEAMRNREAGSGGFIPGADHLKN